MTHTEVAELFAEACNAWVKSETATDPPVQACQEALIVTTNLSGDLRHSVPARLQERLANLATSLSVARAIANPWPELTQAIEATELAMQEAWKLT